MALVLNWLGVHVADFAASLRFYTDVLGIHASDVKPDWAFFDTTGMTLELFGGAPPTPDRSWGRGQAVRPSIQVADLPGTMAEMRRRGVDFTGEIERAASREQVEFAAPEGIRWTLAHAPEYPFGAGLHRPHIGWVELKVQRLAQQRAFYSEVLGLRPDVEHGQAVLRQGPGEPLLFLVTGGQRAAPLQVTGGLLRPAPPLMMSFETDDIAQAAAWLRAHEIPLVIGITHRHWGGTDLFIADADGNPIQVVQYARE